MLADAGYGAILLAAAVVLAHRGRARASCVARAGRRVVRVLHRRFRARFRGAFRGARQELRSSPPLAGEVLPCRGALGVHPPRIPFHRACRGGAADLLRSHPGRRECAQDTGQEHGAGQPGADRGAGGAVLLRRASCPRPSARVHVARCHRAAGVPGAPRPADDAASCPRHPPSPGDPLRHGQHPLLRADHGHRHVVGGPLAPGGHARRDDAGAWSSPCSSWCWSMR